MPQGGDTGGGQKIGIGSDKVEVVGDPDQSCCVHWGGWAYTWSWLRSQWEVTQWRL